MTPAVRLALVAATLFVPALARAAEPAAYKLEPGMQLVYEGTGSASGGYRLTTKETTTVWVLSRNADGTARVLVQTEASQQFNDQSARVSTALVAADVAPDGTATNVQTSDRYASAALPFPLLPKPGATAERAEPFDAVTRFRAAPTTSPTTAPAELTIVAEQTSPMDAIYGLRGQTTYTIDLARGLPVRSETTMEQTWSSKSTSTSVDALKSVERRDEAFVRALADDSKTFFDALSAYQPVVGDEHATAEQLDAAKRGLETAAAKVASPAFKTKLDAMAREHDALAQYRVEQAAERAKRIGQPAADWNLTDLAGKRHALGDYRGKVVVLDFWYRGCGWCIRAMPQINQVVGDFKGQTVAVLGINSDANVEDARFVADKMALAYPTLLGPTVAESYGVRGFPTLILIGKDGTVRGVHVGYSPTLRKDVGAQIAALLK